MESARSRAGMLCDERHEPGRRFFKRRLARSRVKPESARGSSRESGEHEGAKGAKKEKDTAIATATEALHVLGTRALASVEEPTASKIVDATIEMTSLGEPLLETQATETLLALSCLESRVLMTRRLKILNQRELSKRSFPNATDKVRHVSAINYKRHRANVW